MKKIGLSLGLLLLTASFSFAGFVMETATKDLSSGKEVEFTTVHLQDGKVRWDSDRSGKKSSVIFADQTMWMVDHEKKETIMIDKERLEKLSEKMNAVMKQMDETLSKLPPEQQEAMKKMMAGKMGASQAPKVRVEEVGSGTWDKYSCKKYAVYMDDEKKQEICAASPDQIEGGDEAMKSFAALGEFAASLMQSLQNNPLMKMVQPQLTGPLQQMSKINGVPVHTILFDQGKAVQEETMKTAVKKDLDASAFVPPPDYKTKDPFKNM